MSNPNIVFMDGAERNSTSQWTTISGMAVASTSGLDMTGTYCFEFGDSTRYAIKTLPTSYSQLYMSFKFRPYQHSYPAVFCFIDSGGTVVASVGWNTTSNKLELHIGDIGGTLLETGSVELALNTTYSIEVGYVPLNSGGSFTIKVNGVQDVTYSGDTTAGLENAQTVRFNKTPGVSYALRCYIDDVIISDSTWLGNVYIAGMVPKSAGDATDWDPSTGNNYTCVDEVTASDTDYVSTNTADESDLYNIDSLTGTIASVLAVNLCIRAAYEGTPTPTKIKHAVKIGGTEYYGSDVTPTLSFVDYFFLWDQNPNTSGDWSNTNITDLQMGPRSAA